MSLSTGTAELASLLVEAILYGLYIFLFCCTIYVLLYKRSTARPHYGMLFATVSLFLLATAHLITNAVRVLVAFSPSQGHASSTLQNQRDAKSLFKISALMAEILIGDIVLIYRCYVAWGGKRRIIILPLAVLLGTAASSVGLVHSFAVVPATADTFTNRKFRSFVTSTQVLVLLNNVICTSLLAWRLWRMSRAMVSRAQRHTLRSVALIIAESGMITALTWLLFITTYALKSKAEIIVINALAPITGGAFCLIVSRVALGVDNEASSPTNDAIHRRGDEPSASVLPVLDGTGLPHRPVEISVSSRQSVRIETEMDTLYQDKKALAGLGFL